MDNVTLAPTPKAKPDPLAYLRSIGIGGAPDSAPDEAAIPSVITALSNENAPTPAGKSLASPSPANPPKNGTLSVRHQSLPLEMSASLASLNPDVEEAETDPTPPAIKAALPQVKSDPTLTSLAQAPIPAPLKAKKTFGQRIMDALPYIGALGGAMEAAGNRGEAPGANRLLQTEQGLIASRSKKRELDIEQQKANTEAEYKKSLASQYGLQDFTINGPDGQPMTIYAQPKDMGKIGATQVTQAGQITKQEVANQGKVDVEKLRQGAPMLVDPELAKLAGQPQLAGKYVGGQTLKNYIASLRARGIHIADLGEEGLWSVDNAGNRIKRVSVSSPSTARAKAQAENRYIDVFDDSGNLTRISEAEAGARGIPSAHTVFGEQGPTAASRSMSQMAKTVPPHLSDLQQEIKDNADRLGPFMGRWSQLEANKWGSTGDAELDRRVNKMITDFQLAKSAVARTHFGGKTGPQAVAYFSQLFDMQKTPEGLLGVIDAVLPYMEGYSGMTAFTPNVAAAAPSRNGATPKVASPKTSSSSSVQNLLKKYPPKR